MFFQYSTILLSLAQCALLVRASVRALQPRASAAPNPVSIAPSQNWYVSVAYLNPLSLRQSSSSRSFADRYSPGMAMMDPGPPSQSR
jgi:hypothetical protein